MGAPKSLTSTVNVTSFGWPVYYYFKFSNAEIDCSDDLIVDGDESAENREDSLQFHIQITNFFDGFIHPAPVYLPGQIPVYSNAAFQILGYIPEDRNGESFESLLKSKIFEPLRMSNSSLFGPRDTINGVISGNLKESGWAINFGGGAP
ncbi:predicted protein [Histoplasma capsulatum G186AR]|uniref:Beta-lactamase-related domain-containing protein n=1 Tax=Ajellomyces capsulatus (strain G186AR / H82 / ATCC MYA-2454 / RMSCC 2432) TaxID=447093 RepID=C0NNY3_AJECG|nr:uncharacterized protein HCBG_04863 [Histoplasma capsulatum G186AR]EEH06643.1 predicted protein [Histoplasma capsulatum G186AR]